MLAIASSWFAFNRTPQLAPATYVSVLNDGADQPAWLVRVYREGQQIQVRPIVAAALPDGRVFELWMLPDDGSAPRSLGLIDAAAASAFSLTDDQLALLADSSVLAISTEPPGGSPTGVPTGDVVFVGPLVSG